MKWVIMSGGLGNQMFQYAFMLSLKMRGIDIRMNTLLYNFNKMHNGYMLGNAFNIPEDSTNKFMNTKLALIRAIRSNYLPFLVFHENENQFCDEVYHSNKIFFNGYWINPCYFKGINDLVRSSFVFSGIDDINLSIAKKMQNENSVSIHIRRGDYLSNPIYNVCDEDYYRSAIEIISHGVESPKYYIFSDDPVWCRCFVEHLGLNYEIITHNKDVDSYKDMYLMTQCKHNIIANSTFSWWGAWLGNDTGKIIVCPNKWINGRSYNPCLEEWYHIK